MQRRWKSRKYIRATEALGVNSLVSTSRVKCSWEQTRGQTECRSAVVAGLTSRGREDATPCEENFVVQHLIETETFSTVKANSGARRSQARNKIKNTSAQRKPAVAATICRSQWRRDARVLGSPPFVDWGLWGPTLLVQ